jgi:hypothetical protein
VVETASVCSLQKAQQAQRRFSRHREVFIVWLESALRCRDANANAQPQTSEIEQDLELFIGNRVCFVVASYKLNARTERIILIKHQISSSDRWLCDDPTPIYVPYIKEAASAARGESVLH